MLLDPHLSVSRVLARQHTSPAVLRGVGLEHRRSHQIPLVRLLTGAYGFRGPIGRIMSNPNKGAAETNWAVVW
jgi:hypothetical protein